MAGQVTQRCPCIVTLAGDFNCLDIKQLCIIYGLKQLVKIPTRGDNTLDLVLTNLDPFYHSDSIIAFPPFGLSDHSVIALSPRFRDPKSNQKKVVYKRDMRLSRKAMFGRYLSEIDWSFLDSFESVEVKNQLFTNMLFLGLSYILPEKCCLVHPNDHRGSTRICVVSYNFDSVPISPGIILSSNSIEIGLIGKGKLARLIIRQK